MQILTSMNKVPLLNTRKIFEAIMSPDDPLTGK